MVQATVQSDIPPNGQLSSRIYTDYPITELGDTAGSPAPIRPVKLISYDGDKYVRVRVGEVITEIKAGYLYTTEGAPGSAIYAPLSRSLLSMLPMMKFEDANSTSPDDEQENRRPERDAE